MATLRVILTDDLCQEIQIRNYDLGKNLTKLRDMELQVESLRPQFLGDLTHDLLKSSQSLAKKKDKEAINK
jgi:hypothetical protein